MKIYIAGPITNDPNYYEKFAKMEKELRSEGHEPVNPAKNKATNYKEYIDKGLKMLMACEAVIMLEGYSHSKGAMLEFEYAQTVGMKTFLATKKKLKQRGVDNDV